MSQFSLQIPATDGKDAKLKILTAEEIATIQISPDPNAIVDRNKLVNLAKEIEAISSPKGLDRSFAMVKSLKEYKKGVEAARKLVKAPIDAVCDRIQEIAKLHIAPIDVEISRLETINTKFHTAQQEREAEAKRLADAEASKLEEERLRLEREQQQTTSAVEAEAIETKKKEVIQEQSRVVSSAIFARSKPEGAKNYTEYTFMVEDVFALYAHNRNLVIVEPNNVAIKKFISDNYPEIKAGTLTIPGISNIIANKKLR